MSNQYNDQLMPVGLHYHGKKMFVYMKGNLAPICIETDIEFGLKYWMKRKETNDNIRWEIR